MKIKTIISILVFLNFFGAVRALCQFVPKPQPSPSETKQSSGKQNPQFKFKPKRSKSQLLIGTWKDENSEFVLSANKKLEVYFDTGAEVFGTWEVKGSLLYLYEYVYTNDTKELTIHTYDILVLNSNYFQSRSRDHGTVWNATRIK